MWPFDTLRKRKYDRELKAALIALIGAHYFESLEMAQKAEVERELTENFRLSADTSAAWKRWSDWTTIAMFRAAAMEKAGVPSPLPAYAWSDLFKPWRLWRHFNFQYEQKGFDNRPFFASMAFRPMSQATRDARQLLRSHGVNVPDRDPWDLGSLDGLDTSYRQFIERLAGRKVG